LGEEVSRRISVIIDERGTNRVANELNRVNVIGDRVAKTFGRVVSSIGRVGKAIWRYRYRIMAAASATAYFVGRTYASFEDTIVRTKVALSASEEQMERLEDMALHLGRTTSYASNEAAEGMLILGRADMDTEEILKSIIPVLDLAKVAEIELGEAAEKTAHILKMWSMDASEATRIADALAVSEQLATGSIIELAEALKFAGVGASKANIPLEDTVAMLLAMANSGIMGSMAGRALRMSFIRFERIKTGQVAKMMGDTFERLGSSVETAVTAVQRGEMEFVPFVKILTDAGATLGDMANIFEAQAAPAMLALGQATGESYDTVVETLVNSAGYSRTASEEIAGTLEDTVDRIKNSLGVMAIELGSTVAPDLKRWLDDTLHPWINDITDTWETGGDTWQEKLSTVWNDKLLPEFDKGLDSLYDRMRDWLPTIGSLIGRELPRLLAVGIGGTVGGLWDLTKEVVSEGYWPAFKAHVRNTLNPVPSEQPMSFTDRMRSASTFSRQDEEDPDAPMSQADYYSILGMLNTIPSSLRIDPSQEAPLPGVTSGVDTAQILLDYIDELERNTTAIDNNTAATGSDDSDSSGSSSLFSDLLSGSGDWLGGQLMSFVTEPLEAALDRSLGPTQTRIGQLADIAMRAFDVPLGMLNSGLDAIIGKLGRDDSGRYTGFGAYQYQGAGASSGMSVSSGVSVKNINIHGVKDGEDAAHRVTSEIAAYQQLSSSQTARSLKKGMIKREAQEA
jgi:TP901 family phage tail tape measure protein